MTRTFLLLALPIMIAGGVSKSSATPRAAYKPLAAKPLTASQKRANARNQSAKRVAPRRKAPRVLAKIAGAPPVTARRSAPSRRLLAIEYVRQASVAYNNGDYKRTLALCETAAQWYPTYARAHIWKGAAYQKLGKYSQARSSYAWGRALSPDSADAARADRGLKELGYR